MDASRAPKILDVRILSLNRKSNDWKIFNANNFLAKIFEENFLLMNHITITKPNKFSRWKCNFSEMPHGRKAKWNEFALNEWQSTYLNIKLIRNVVNNRTKQSINWIGELNWQRSTRENYSVLFEVSSVRYAQREPTDFVGGETTACHSDIIRIDAACWVCMHCAHRCHVETSMVYGFMFDVETLIAHLNFAIAEHLLPEPAPWARWRFCWSFISPLEGCHSPEAPKGQDGLVSSLTKLSNGRQKSSRHRLLPAR